MGDREGFVCGGGSAGSQGAAANRQKLEFAKGALPKASQTLRLSRGHRPAQRQGTPRSAAPSVSVSPGNPSQRLGARGQKSVLPGVCPLDLPASTDSLTLRSHTMSPWSSPRGTINI